VVRGKQKHWGLRKTSSLAKNESAALPGEEDGKRKNPERPKRPFSLKAKKREEGTWGGGEDHKTPMERKGAPAQKG